MENYIPKTYIEPGQLKEHSVQFAIVSIFFGLVFGMLNYFVGAVSTLDFGWSVKIAQDFISGIDPYAFEASSQIVPYPLPVIFVGIPLLPFSVKLAGSVFVAISVGLLVYGMLRHDQFWRAPLLFSLPFIGATVLKVQWAPIILAAWFFPIIAPYFCLVKPQNALPVAFAKWSWKGVFIAAGILLVTLILDPTWPIRWLSKSTEYVYFIPFITLPFGPLLLISLRYRQYPVGRLLFFMSVLPLRAIYDLPLLWIVARNRYQVWLLTALSWLALIFFPESSLGINPIYSVPLLFAPCLLFVVWEYDQQLIKQWLGLEPI